MIILQSGYRLFEKQYSPDMYVILEIKAPQIRSAMSGSDVALPQ